MKKTQTKLLSILLTLCMVLTLLPMTAFAAGDLSSDTFTLNGHTSSGGYYVNGASSFTSDSAVAWNAKYVASTGTLTLRNYSGGAIKVEGAIVETLTIELIGTNTITDSSIGINNAPGGAIVITSAEEATLTVNSGATGITNASSTESASALITISGKANVAVNVNAGNFHVAGIRSSAGFSLLNDASLTVRIHNGSGSNGYTAGIYTAQRTEFGSPIVTINTSGKLDVDVSDSGANGTGSIYAPNGIGKLTKADGGITLKWKINSTFDTATFFKTSFDTTGWTVNKNTVGMEVYSKGIEIPAVTTTTLPNGGKGQPYRTTLAATGTTPITWNMTGTLPAGLTLDANSGVLSGTPTEAGYFQNLYFYASNGAGDSVPRRIYLTINEPPVITTTAVTSGKVGVSYDFNFAGTPTTGLTWTVGSGTLPDGVVLNDNGFMTGIPTTAGSYTFTVKAANPGASVTKQFTMTVAHNKSITLSGGDYTFPGATTGYTTPTAHSVTVTNTGEEVTDTLTVALSGTNAASFTLSKTTIASLASGSGAGYSDTFTVTPKTGLAVGNYTATVTVSGTDITPQTINVSFAVTAEVIAPTITTTELPAAVKDQPYSYQMQATGTAPITWSIDSGSLPTGLTLNASSGLISGTPTVAGDFSNIGFKATNNKASDTKTITLTVYEQPVITTDTVTSGKVGVSYSFNFAGTPTTGLTWTVESGTLPTGVDLGTSGFMTGRPTTAGSYTFTVKAANPGASVTKQFTMTVYDTFTLSQSGTYTFPPAVVGYAAQTAKTITVTNASPDATGQLYIFFGGSDSGSFTIATSPIANIPAGETATFTVTPKTGLAVGTHTATVTVRAGGNDNTAKTFNVSFTVTTATPVALTFTDSASYDIPASTVGTAISNINVAGGASGGTTPYTFTASGLPAGLSISTAGVISGTPTTAGAAGTATITVTDSATPTHAIKNITIAYGAISAAAPTTYAVNVTGGTGGGNYAAGAAVTITAGTAPSGQQFKEWTGADSLTFTDGTSKTSSTAKFTMPAGAVSVTATYEDIPAATYAVTYDANGGSGSMIPGSATDGMAFTLPTSGFTPPAGKQFKEWAIGSIGGTRLAAGGTHTFTAATTVYAIWEDIPVSITSVDVTPATANVQKGTTQQFTAAVSGTGAYNNTVAWTVTGGGAGTSISTSGLLTVAAGETASTLTVKATANGDDTKTDTANVTVTDAPVTTYALTVTNGTGTGNYAANAVVNISANTPAAGKQFKNWTTSDGGSFGNASSAATTYTMPAGAATVTANYEDIPVTVSSIAVNSTTHKTAYTVGNALDVTNLTILVTKSDASTETVNVTSGMVTGFNSSAAAASQTLTITYEGKTTTFNISITAAPPVFVAVTGITGVPTTATAGTPLSLTGTVAPANATNKTIVWSVKSAGTTGASISGSTLSTTAAGTVKITATITNGLTASSNYAQDFDIIVSAAPISTHIVTVNDSYAGTTGAGNYAKDATVNIYAGNRSNYSFNGWTVVSGGVTITNPGSKNATFTMPNNAVTVKANWSYNGGGGSSGGGTSYTYYTITATAGTGGSISPSGSASVREDLDKTYTVTPNTGYVISDVLVDGKSVGAVKTYTFKDVSAKHTISATFKVDTHTNPQTGVEFDFDDVKETDWFYEDAVYAFVNSLMNGTGAKTFSPNANTTRGMIVAILHRLASEPEVTNAASFTDVSSDKYYAKAIAWAYENKIISGYSAESFGPDDAITREQMATILMNYAKLMGYDVTAAADLSTFSDAGSISGYAKLAMQWANAGGLVSGKGNGILDPGGNATRAQVAAILHRFCENIVK